VRQKKRARPLHFEKEFLLYRSAVDIQDVAVTCKQRCQIGAALSVSGFVSLISVVAPMMPAPLVVGLMGGALVNSYVLLVTAQRLIGKLADRHVMKLSLMPMDMPEEVPEPKAEEGEIASILFSAATSEERLLATPELHLHVKTGCSERWFTLADLPEELETSSFASALGEGATEGEASEMPATFTDLAKRLGLLHMEVENGTSPDQALLAAIVASPKIVVDERVELLPDSMASRVAMLGDFTRGDVEKALKTTSSSESPEATLTKLGKRARLGGVSLVLAGVLFILGENARDEYGVARYRNLAVQLP